MFTLEDLTLLMCLFNSLFIIMVTIFWVKEHYFICSVEEWNKVAKVYNVAVTSGLVTEDGELTPPVAPDNVGFFKEQVDEDFYEEEEEEEGKKKKNGKH